MQDAIVRRPLTPGSVAGVARRTTRRVMRRATISIKGAAVWSFGGTYYQPSGGRYVVVYID